MSRAKSKIHCQTRECRWCAFPSSFWCYCASQASWRGTCVFSQARVQPSKLKQRVHWQGSLSRSTEVLHRKERPLPARCNILNSCGELPLGAQHQPSTLLSTTVSRACRNARWPPAGAFFEKSCHCIENSSKSHNLSFSHRALTLAQPSSLEICN